ncbi:MAG TPA: hypothetical protein VIJ14_01000 [Rhabdochlamydiaceae bacterium]
MPIEQNLHFDELPPYLKEILKPLRKEIVGLFNQKPKGYPNPRITPIDDVEANPSAGIKYQKGIKDLQDAFKIGRETRLHTPYLNEAESNLMLSQREFPKQFAKYINPYQKMVMDRIAEEGNRNLQENLLPMLENQFIKSGQHGSLRHRELTARAARDIQNEISGHQTKSLERGYQQAGQLFNADQVRRIQAAQGHADLGAMANAGKAADIAMLENQGKMQLQHEQARKDLAYSDFMNEQERPSRQISQHLAFMQGVPYERSFNSFSQTPGVAQMNLPGQIGQLATGLLGARMAAGRKRGGHLRGGRY